MELRGRVVDAEGVEVTLESDLPLYVPPAQAGVLPQKRFTARTGRDGDYAFSLAVPGGFPRLPGLELRALDGGRVSRTIHVAWEDGAVTAPDLMLCEGVFGRVVVRWKDASPVAGASLLCFLRSSADEAQGSEFVDGVTDECGVLAIGPLPEVAYESVIVMATHPTAPALTKELGARRLDPCMPFEIMMKPGRSVSGRLVMPSGEPAEGYRLARVEGSMDTVVCTTDADGRFTVVGLDPAGGAIAVCDRLRPAGHARALGSISHMIPAMRLMTLAVPPDVTDLGTVVLKRKRRRRGK